MDKPYNGQKQKYAHEGNHDISYKTAQVISIWLDFAHRLSPSSLVRFFIISIPRFILRGDWCRIKKAAQPSRSVFNLFMIPTIVSTLVFLVIVLFVPVIFIILRHPESWCRLCFNWSDRHMSRLTWDNGLNL